MNPDAPRRKLPAAALLLLLIAAVSALGLAGVLAAEGADSAAALEPIYTLAPTLTPASDQGAAPATPTPVVALALQDARGPAAAPPDLPALTPTGFSPSDQVFASAQSFQAAPTPAAPPIFRLFLGLVSNNYQTPPRETEPFRVLPAFPASEWPAPPETLTLSRISLHALSTGDPYIMEFIRRARPRVVKAVGDYGWLKEVKEASPETVTVGRIVGQDGSWVNALDPAAAAEAYISRHLEQYRLNPFVDYWEGWNEFIFGPAEELRWFAAFEAERACRMQALGFRAAVGGFAVGWPRTYPEMELFLPALEAAHRCGGIFHLHEYNKPLLQCAVRAGPAEIIPGAPALRVPAGPLTFRYRFWYEGYLKPRGLGDLPLVISEYGIDAVQVILCPDPDPYNSRNWKDFSQWWASEGFGGDGPQAYVNQLAWADREMRHDAYVLGATVFTAGAVDSGHGWNGWDIHDVLIPLAHYLATQR